MNKSKENMFKVVICQGSNIIFESDWQDNSNKEEVENMFSETLLDPNSGISCSVLLDKNLEKVIIPKNIIMNSIIKLIPYTEEKKKAENDTKKEDVGDDK